MILSPFLISFLVAFLCSPILRKLAIRWNIVDNPSLRKLQKNPVPLFGGVAVYCGVVLGSCIVAFQRLDVWGLFLGATLIFIVSLIDDKKELSARIRIFVQLIAACIVMMFGLRISFLPNNLIGDMGEIVITLLWILGITNAFNYLDGLDGLCSGLGIISCFFFFIILFFTGQKDLIFLPLILMGACLGFMPHNFKKEKMFLGDAGSMFIGFFIAGIALIGNWASDDISKISVPILILGVPIFDMCFTTLMRYKEKKIKNLVQWLEYAGRDHFHHYLLDLGLRPHGAVLFIFAISLSMGINAFTIIESHQALYGVLAILEGVIMFGLIGVLMVLGRRLHKENQVRERVGI